MRADQRPRCGVESNAWRASGAQLNSNSSDHWAQSRRTLLREQHLSNCPNTSSLKLEQTFHDISRLFDALGQADFGQQFEQGAFADGNERAIRIFRQRLEAEILGKLAREQMPCGVGA